MDTGKRERRAASRTRYRRSPHVLCYWKHGTFLFHNYATGVRAGATPLAVDVLDFFDDWKPIDALLQDKPGAPREALEELLTAFLEAGLLHRSDRPIRPEEEAMARFDRWNPEAGFFHMATKDVRFIDQRTAQQHLSRQAEDWPMPVPVKRYEGAATVPLDPVDRDSPVARALLERRSWRRFGDGKVARETFSTLLGLTAGVQHWVTVSANQRIPLKTSPSGGARHPVELYTLAWGIDGLEPGLYHYASDAHLLELLRPGLGAERVPAYLPFGDYWCDACAIVLFSAVYERDLWRYGYSRAYRAPFIEAGHLCQTFCLLASSYSLAPFCAMGLADSAIERDLGLDGVSESVLYIAGVGIRPDGVAWAPAPHGFEDPRVEPNPYLQDVSRKPRAPARRRSSAP